MSKGSIREQGIRFECQGSGKCCLSRGEYGYVYVTNKDRRRLARHLEMSQAAFTKKHCSKTDGHFHLNAPEEDCEFLDQRRCAVYEARPTQCRTWPFWPENMNAKVWNTEVAPFCPGIGKGKLYTAEEIAAILRESEEE